MCIRDSSQGGRKLFEQNPGGAPATLLTVASHFGYRTSFIGKVGNDMHGKFCLLYTSAADASQLKEVNRRAEIDDTGTMCTEGIIKGNENGCFVCMEETARKMLPYNKEYELNEGKYPGGTQEIAAGRAFFSEMGYDDVKVGDTVTPVS